MKHPLFFVTAPAAFAFVVALTAACTSTTTVAPTGPAACDPTQCATGNMCIPDANGVSACRLPCMAHSDCPFNTQCAVSTPQNYCVKLTTATVQKPTGQWGTHCLPQDGLSPNKACDADTGFACLATGPTDALAYCTQYDCTADLDCAGGYYCATINNAPNAKTAVRTFGKTRTVCKKHEYCSPCAGDLDCPTIDGKQSKCTQDDSGTRYCATQCTATTNCRLDATCTGTSDDGTKVCRPRAHTCKGDGSLCSPCRSDADCPMGFCLKGAYSPEMFCSVKSKVACITNAATMTTSKSCPAFTYSGTQIGCEPEPASAASADPNIPADQCIGIVALGDQGDVGCYTRHP